MLLNFKELRQHILAQPIPEKLKNELDKMLTSGSFELKENFFKSYKNFTTTGSSSKPKTVVHTGKTLYESAVSSIEFFNLTEDDKTLVCLSFERMGGWMAYFRALLSGSEVISCHPHNLVESLLENKPKIISLVPSQLPLLLESEEDFSFLRFIFVGGAELSTSLWERSLSKKLPLIPCLGSSESGAMYAAHPCPFSELKKNEYKIMPRREVKLSPAGLIQLGKYGRFLGYKNGELSLEGNLFSSQDLGEFTNTNTLRFLGRNDLVFISGGINVNPLHIESVLEKLNKVERATIIPYSDEKWGHVGALFYWAQEKISQEEFKNFFERYLEPQERPKRIIYQGEFPAGQEKINRSLLKKKL